MAACLLALIIVLGGLILAREAGNAGVALAGKLMGGTVSYRKHHEWLPHTVVTFDPPMTWKHVLGLHAGGIAGSVLWIALLGVVCAYSNAAIFADQGAPAMETLMRKIRPTVTSVGWATFGFPFDKEIWSRIYDSGLVLPFLRRAVASVPIWTSQLGVPQVAFFWAYLASIYLAISVLPIFNGVGSFTDIWRSWMVNALGELFALTYMDVCSLITVTVLGSVFIGEVIALI